LRLANIIDDVRTVITFFTVIPIGGSHDLSKAFRSAGISIIIIPPITGLIPGLVGFYMWILTHNNLLSASLAYALLLVLTGLNHIDGYSDVIDALMVRGSIEDRIKVLKDPHRGSAAIVMVVMLVIIAVSALTSLANSMWLSLFIAEIISKSSCCLCAFIGREPPYRGLGWLLTRQVRENRYLTIAALIIGLLITYALSRLIGIVVFIASIAFSIFLFMLIQRSLGGAVGDLYGFTLEVSRVLALVLFAILLKL